MICTDATVRLIRVPLTQCFLGDGHIEPLDWDAVVWYRQLLVDNLDKEHDPIKVRIERNEDGELRYEVVRGRHRYIATACAVDETGRDTMLAYVEGDSPDS